MVRTAAQKIADVLIFLCGFLIFCDILLLPLTPALAYFRFQNPASWSRASVCWPLWRTARRSPRRTPSTSSGPPQAAL